MQIKLSIFEWYSNGGAYTQYHLEKMDELTILDETNTMVRPFYNPDDKDFKRIIFRVKVI